MKHLLWILLVLLCITPSRLYAQVNNSHAFDGIPDSLRPKGNDITLQEIYRMFQYESIFIPRNRKLNDSLIAIMRKFAEGPLTRKQRILVNVTLMYHGYHLSFDKSDSVVRYADRVLADIPGDSASFKKYYPVTIVMKASALTNVGHYEESLKTYQEALPAIKRLKDSARLGLALGNIGDMYSMLKDNPKAISYGKQALEVFRKRDPFNINLFIFGTNISNSYIDEFFATGQTNKSLVDSAEVYVRMAITSQRPADTLGLMSFYCYSAAYVAFAKGTYQTALDIINYGKKKEFEEADRLYAYVVVRKALECIVLLKLNRKAEAMQLVQEALKAEQLGNFTVTELFYRELSHYFENAGDTKTALVYQKKLLSFIEEKKKMEHRGQLFEIELKYDAEQIQSQLLKTKLQNAEQQRVFNTTIFIAVFVLLLLCVIIIVVSFRNKRNRLLAAQKATYAEVLNKKNEQLHEQIIQLEDYQQKLEKDYALKNRLVSIIGHDILTPLKFMNLVGRSLIKKGKIVNGEVLEDVQMMVSTSQSLQSMASNMLNWTKHHDRNMQFIAAAFELKDLVNTVLESTSSMAEVKKLSVINEVPEDTVLHQYKDLLQTLVLQLITNSIKYSERGIIQITAQVKAETISLTVTDEGIGIEPEMVNELLNSNKHVTRAANDLKGYGFGFLIIKDILKILQGKIGIKSTVNQGTSITIDIPANVE